MPRIEVLNDKHLKKDLAEFRVGDIIRVHQRIKETTEAGKEKERIQVFEGLVIARKHGKGISGTLTVRKVASGVGVERIFPLHSPSIEKIEVVRRQIVRRAKLYYVRGRPGSQPRVRKAE